MGKVILAAVSDSLIYIANQLPISYDCRLEIITLKGAQIDFGC